MISDYFLPFDYSLDRYCSIIHSRLRLDTCALFYYLFKLQFYFLLFVVVVLVKRLNLFFFFYIVPNMLLHEKIAFSCCSLINLNLKLET